MYMNKQDLNDGIITVVNQLEENAEACDALASTLQHIIEDGEALIAAKHDELSSLYAKQRKAREEAEDFRTKAKKIYEAK